MRKWQTIAVTALSTLALSGAGFTAYQMNQPTHYEGATFTNVKQSTNISSNTDSNSTSSSTESQSTMGSSNDTNTSNEQSQSVTATEQNTTENPTFYAYLYQPNGSAGVDPSNYTYEFRAVYTVTGEEVSCGQDSRDAELFCKWMNSIAHGKGHLDNSLQSNYNYWVQNVKGQ